jgi:hypothetical protein
MMSILKVMVVIAATAAYGSMLEWVVHKIVYHRWFAKAHAKHHAEYGRTRFLQPGPYRSLQPWWVEVVVIGLHAPGCLVLGEHAGVVVGATAFLAIAAYAIGAGFLHAAIHRPNGRLIERTAWYRRRAARHLAHHRDPRVNFTVASQSADRLLGTFREGAGFEISAPATGQVEPSATPG